MPDHLFALMKCIAALLGVLLPNPESDLFFYLYPR